MTYLRSVVVFLLGLAISGIAAWHQANQNRVMARSELAKAAVGVEQRLLTRIRLYEYGLKGARGALIMTGGRHERALFRRYAESRDTDREFPGARGFGFIRKVPAGQEEAFLAAARADGKPDFTIRQLGPTEGDSYVIQYIEPVERNLAAVGLNIRSEANRRLAAETAMLSGRPTLTGPITLVQKTGERMRSLLFLLPVYRHGLPTSTQQERAAACIGWAYTPLALSEVLSDFALDAKGIHLVLKDVTDKGEGDVFFDTQPGDGAGIPTDIRQLDVYGRKWRAEVAATAAFVNNLHQTQPLAVFGLGACLSLLLSALFGLILSARVRKLAMEEQRAQLAAIVEYSSDAIIGESMDGKVLSWNKGAERLFGHTREAILGKALADHLLPPEKRHEDEELLKRIGAGEVIPPFDAVRIDKNGQPIDVSIAAGAIRAEDGRLIGIAKLVRDIRERKEAERQLKEFNLNLETQIQARTAELETARRDLRNVLDAVPSMIGYWDRDLCNRFANKAYVDWFGKEPAQILGRHIRELLGDKIFEANLPYMQAALNGQVQQFERTIESPSGRRHALANYLPDERNGVVIGFYVVVHDITDITESGMRLAHQQEALANIIKGTRTGTWEWDLQAGTLLVNDHWLRIIGLGPDQPLQRPIDDWLDRVHPEDRPRLQEALQRHFSKLTDYFECENRIRDNAGGWVWVLDRGQVLNWSPDGRPLRMYGTHQDIDAFKVAQADASRMGALLDSVLRAATSVSIIATDTAGTISVFNAGAEQMLGYSAEEMVGQTSPAVLHLASEVAERARELSMARRQQIEGFRVFVHMAEIEGAETRQWTYVRKNGSHLTVALTVTPIRDEQGATVGYLGVAQDITERLRQDTDLRQAKYLAESANAAKSVFLANMSHEIRTPMNAVIGAAYLLESTRLDDEQRQLLRKVQVAGRSLLGIINDVLDLAKIEAGEVQIESNVFSPDEVLDDIEQLFSEQAAAKGIEFQVVGRQALPGKLLGDATRLKQVLVNLVGNAVKFTHEGSVVVLVQQDGASTQPLWLRWSVRDTGTGISAEVRDRLFKPFSQADASITRKFGGTGLGLSIVKQLVEMMGGEVGLESVPGRGSEFWIRLPFESPASDAQLPAQTGALSLLVVDDVPTDRRIIAAMCRTLGWRATELPGGQSLIDHFQRLVDTGQPLPDAMLVDWHMPGMDGDEALRQLAERHSPSRLPSVLIITADEKADLASIDAGRLTDGILVKPVSPSELFNAVNGSVARRTGNLDRVAASTKLTALQGKWLHDVRILLVDDSDMNLDVGRRILEKEGATVRTCIHGQEAVEVLRQDPNAFDVVLMDVQMPVMDGYTATQVIRTDLGLKSLPVLALTAGALSEERRKAELAGMDAFLTKPLDPGIMVQTVRRAVERSRGMSLPAPDDATPRPVAPAQGWPAIEGIDVELAGLRLSEDLDLFQKLLKSFSKEFNGAAWLEELQSSEPEDLKRWLQRLHKLKGSAGLLGATAIHEEAAAIEARLIQGEGLIACQPSIEELLARLQALASRAAEVIGAQPDSVEIGSSGGGIAEPAPGQISELRARLRRHDMLADELARPVIAWLRAQGESERAKDIEDALEVLQFSLVERLIAQRFGSAAT